MIIASRLLTTLALATLIVVSSSSPALAHLGGAEPEVSEASLESDSFSAVLHLDAVNEDDLAPLQITVELHDRDDQIDTVEVAWTAETGRPARATAERDGSSNRFRTAAAVGPDASLDLTIVVNTVQGQTDRLTFETAVHRVEPRWVVVTVLISGLWTVPFCVWLLSRTRRAWLPRPAPQVAPTCPQPRPGPGSPP